MLRIVFAGTPELSKTILESILQSKNYEILACFTQPDRSSGRGRKLTESPVKHLAIENNIPVYQPETLTNNDIFEKILSLKPDVIIVAAYGLMIPKKFLNIPKYGCINVHMSLLPRWRGASPIQQAILTGDQYTGVTIMQMDHKLDTGDILSSSSLEISKTDTSASLQKKLALIGSKELINVLSKISTSKIVASKQDSEKATYAHKINKQDAKIDWGKSSSQIERQVRAFNPWPIAFTQFTDITIRIWQVSIIETKTTEQPGTIISASKSGIEVATADGILSLQKIQLPGKNPMDVAEILNSKRELFQPGMCFK